MDIPKLNVDVTIASVNGQMYEVIEYEDYVKNKEHYKDRTDLAVPVDYKDDKNIILPVKGEYPKSGMTSIPGLYNAGCVDFIVTPEEAFVNRYIPKNMVTMSNTDDIKRLIEAEEESRKLDEPFITTPDSITNVPIKQSDAPEMKCLKMALNAKHIDLDKYAGRFGKNFPNDKRQLKNSTATLNIIKRYCESMDMEAVLILRDSRPDAPNPMNTEIAVSLTENTEDEELTEQYSPDGEVSIIYEDDDSSSKEEEF